MSLARGRSAEEKFPGDSGQARTFKTEFVTRQSHPLAAGASSGPWKLQLFAPKVLCLVSEARSIPAGPTEACDQACAYGIADGRKYDRDYCGCCLCRLRREGPKSRNQHVRPGSNELRGQRRQSLWTSFGGAVLEGHILSLAVAQLVKTFQQRLHQGGVLSRSEREELIR